MPTWAARIAGVTVFDLSAVSSAQASSVTFTNINDALPSRCYDSSITEPDSTNPNRLVIGIDTGVALVNSEFGAQYLERGCAASTAAFYSKSTMDTISFLVEAPAGFYISKISFSQFGSITNSRGGQAFLGATWVVDEDANVVPYNSTTKTWSATVNLTGQNKTLVPVSVTTFLTASGISPQSSSAVVSNPAVVVELLPLP